MTVTVSNKLHHSVLYLSPMHIAQRVILGYEITNEKMTEEERKEKYEENMKAEKKKLSKYICNVMKKLSPDGPRCIMGAYHFG
jgi:hypothetical protein